MKMAGVDAPAYTYSCSSQPFNLNFFADFAEGLGVLCGYNLLIFLNNASKEALKREGR